MARVKSSPAWSALADRHDPQGLPAFVARYLEWLRVHNYAEPTVLNRELYLGYFVAWCAERGLTQPREITKPILERYQRALYHLRKANGEPLTFRGQHARLVPIRGFFRWLARQNHLLYNPASELELPRLEQRLPKHVLTKAEVEQVMAQSDLSEPMGMRDRAILETFYSTGMRRRELMGLSLFDLDRERGTVMIRQGKGKKDRMIPIGERAIRWIDRYQNDVRPALVVGRMNATLFLTHTGEPFTPNRLTQLVREYVQAANLGKSGSCHLFRHTMATLMLENGADIRYIQAMLGHAELSTTQIYTQVSIRKLKEIHTATHPGKLRTARSAASPNAAADESATPPPSAEELLSALAAEAGEEDHEAED
ncbi:MAG: site-specific tyrosine recombinase XerC [Hyphomicrobium sp.]|uniref:site-specific tyrosine recombinase XerC n=1 Tax=Hyphomicrobium sp. TaxID=82 RepID=UPI003D0B4743